MLTQNVGGRDRLARALLAALLTVVAIRTLGVDTTEEQCYCARVRDDRHGARSRIVSGEWVDWNAGGRRRDSERRVVSRL